MSRVTADSAHAGAQRVEDDALDPIFAPGVGGASTNAEASARAAKSRNGRGAGGSSDGAVAEKPSKDALIDLSETLTVESLASKLRAVANEPGEFGEVRFRISGAARLPTGVPAKLEAWAQMSLVYAVTDQNFSMVALDFEGAVAAGIDVGFFQASVEGGLGKNYMRQWFAGSAIAASWLIDELRALDADLGGGFLKFAGDSAQRDPFSEGYVGPRKATAAFSVDETKAFVEGKAGVNVGAAQATGSQRITKVGRTFIDDEGRHIRARETHNEKNLAIAFDLGGVTLTGRYYRDDSTVAGSPIYYANGHFAEQSFTIGAKLSALFGKGREMSRIPCEKVEKLVVNGFAALEAAVGGGQTWLGKLNASLFEQIVDEIYRVSKLGKKILFDAEVDITFNWNEHSSDGIDPKLMYFRVKVEPILRAGGKVDGGAAGGGLEVSARKSEVVYESIGAETIAYVQRQYIYQNPDRPWDDFKEQNREQIEALVKNVATPGFEYYVPSVEEAFHADGGENYDAAIEALEEHWCQETRAVKDVIPDASQVSRHLDSATSIFTFYDSTKREHMAAIFDIFLKYEEDPQLLKYFFDKLPHYDVDLEELYELAEETGYGDSYRALRSKALAARS